MSSPHTLKRSVSLLCVVLFLVSVGGAAAAQSPVVTPASAEPHLLFAAPLATELPSTHFAVGDLDGDGATDVIDPMYLVEAFGSRAGEPGYDGRCDFDADLVVTTLDLLTLMAAFGQ